MSCHIAGSIREQPSEKGNPTWLCIFDWRRMMLLASIRPLRTGRQHASHLLRQRPPAARPRRTFVTEAVQTLTEGYLDLALALPFPASWPIYSSTIIVLTVVSRVLITVPFSAWAMKRRWRLEEVVLPQVEKLKPEVAKHVIKEMSAAGVRGSKDELRSAHAQRTSQLLQAKLKQLTKEHSCRPLVTALIPALSQLPLFVGTSVVLREASMAPTPLDSESFFTLTTLTHTDPTTTLPIILGLITLANIETSQWWMSAADRQKIARRDERRAALKAQGHIVPNISEIVRTTLRGASVVRIIIASLVPGSVVIYWVSSATFGLVQTWIFDYIDHRRKSKRPPPLPAPLKDLPTKPRSQ